jgi:hypothetical protein
MLDLALRIKFLKMEVQSKNKNYLLDKSASAMLNYEAPFYQAQQGENEISKS